MTVLLLIGVMLLLALLGIPLVFAILGASLVTIFVYRPGLPLELIPQFFVSGVNHYALLAVAFFFLAGELMNAGGITQRIVAFAQALVGHIRGNLAHVNIVTSMMFACISGSAAAGAAVVGSVLGRSMVRKGFKPQFAGALTAVSSVMGPIIPPSIPMIIFAVLTEQSVGKLFLAGMVPGILIGASLMGYCYFMAVRKGWDKGEPFSRDRMLTTGRDAIVALFVPVFILVGILGGIFTATEAGAIAVGYSFVAGMFILKELTWAGFYRALVRASIGTATVLVVVGASSVIAWIIADLQVAKQVSEVMFSISENPMVVLLLINIFLLVVGLFLDALPAIIILTPIFFPIAVGMGIDPTHFGVVMIVNLLIGLCTPPVGILLYLSAAAVETRPEGVIREAIPMVVILIGVLMLITYVPSIVLTFPNMFYD